MRDLTRIEHLNVSVPADAVWWECPKCGDYAWVWPGEDAPDHTCDDDVEG